MSYQQMSEWWRLEQSKAKIREQQLCLLLQEETEGLTPSLFHISINRHQAPGPLLWGRFHNFAAIYQLTMDRVAGQLDSIFNLPEYNDLTFRCVLLDLHESNTRFPVGKEISVIPRKGVELKNRSPEEWKTLMLKCWAALNEREIKVSSKCSADVQRIAVTGDLRTPFSCSEDSPVRAVTITPEDLAPHHIAIKASKEQEKECWEQLLQIIQDQGYWQSKHSKQTKQPKGLVKIQPQVAAYKLKEEVTKADRGALKFQMQEVVRQRERAIFAKRKRDPMGKALYSCIMAQDGLMLNPEFQKLKQDHDNFTAAKL